MARLGTRPQPPRGTTLALAVLPWLAGAREMLAGVEIPYDAGQWALLPASRCSSGAARSADCDPSKDL